MRYASYMLRLRLVWNDEEPIWVASMEDTVTGSHRSFPNLEALTAFLLAEYGGRRTAAKGGAQSEGEEKRSLESK